jgi:hypothetical protein
VVEAPECVRGGRGEVDGFPSQTSVLASGEGEQRLEQPRLALAGSDDALAHLAEGDRVCLGVSERGLGKVSWRVLSPRNS